MKCKKDQDLRKLDAQSKYDLRQTVIRLKKEGMKAKKIQECTGYNKVQITRIWQAYSKNGEKAIRPQSIGRPIGSFKLSQKNEKTFGDIVSSKTPAMIPALKFLYRRVWSPSALRDLCALNRIHISLGTARKLLRFWGIYRPKNWSSWYVNPKLRDYYRILFRIREKLIHS